jgi:serine/threonine-protein kinase
MSSRAPSTETPDLSGKTLGDFKLLRRLGQGGMGQVYLAEQISLNRKVALKLLRPELASNPQALERFKLEAKAVAQATHANIVQVYYVSRDDEEERYMALEYVEGRNLKEYLATKGPPELILALSIMRQVASALQRAGEMGIVHRDIKPDNILLTRKGEVKVADFGLSRVLEPEKIPLNLTATGVTMGTPLYMSPEQVEGKAVDPRSDIYSFGVTCFHMLAGQPPFRGESPFEVALMHVRKQPPQLASLRPDLPESLCAIVHKMLAKDPDERYQTGRDLLRDINRCREGLSGVATTSAQPTISVEMPALEVGAATAASERIPPPPPPPKRGDTAQARRPGEGPRRRRKPRRRVGLIVAGVLLSLLAALGTGAALGWRGQRAAVAAVAQGVRPADAGTIEAICLPHKREQTLREAAEQYLSPQAGKTSDLAGGLGVCMDLGLFYLDENRLDDADALFRRLEPIQDPRSYKVLGLLGEAIVQALRNQAESSNGTFRGLFGGPGKKVDRPWQPLQPVLQSANWRYWIARARWHNYQNGVPEKDVPHFLRDRFPVKSSAPPRKPPENRGKGDGKL